MRIYSILILAFSITIWNFQVVHSDELFPLTIIHLNDMHARFDETNWMSSTCKERDECIGGYARVVTKVKELKVSKADKNPIYLNIGDNFQGTLWYNEFKWNVTSHFLNLYPADFMTIGNHEFDHGIEGLVPFMEKSKTKILISNINDTNEPSFQNTYESSVIYDKFERAVGIIGVTTTFKSNWGNVIITDEVEAVKIEVEKMKSQGIKIIVLISHCGLDVDKEIANQVDDIDIIVGGHSHSFLYSGENPPGPDIPVDNYPSKITKNNGDEVLIVQASAYNKYLGDITLYFDDDGKVQKFEGFPHFLSHDVIQDAEILTELIPWKNEILKIQNRVVGNSKFEFSSFKCYVQECGMGDLTTDAYVYAFLENELNDDGWSGATISLTVPGGIRSGLEKGNLMFGDLITTTPFENLLHSVELQGHVIKAALEKSVENLESLMLLQVSGLKIVYDLKQEKNRRVISVDVLCRICQNNIPMYEPLDPNKIYRVVMPSFLSNGGDGFNVIGENGRNKIMGPRDIDALSNYLEKFSPINMPLMSGRIKFV